MKLKSSQGEVFEVDEDVACMSQLVKNMVEDSGADEEIPLPNVKTAILGKVLDYCKFHKDEPPAEIQKPLKYLFYLTPSFRSINSKSNVCTFGARICRNPVEVRQFAKIFDDIRRCILGIYQV